MVPVTPESTCRTIGILTLAQGARLTASVVDAWFSPEVPTVRPRCLATLTTISVDPEKAPLMTTTTSVLAASAVAAALKVTVAPASVPSVSVSEVGSKETVTPEGSGFALNVTSPVVSAELPSDEEVLLSTASSLPPLITLVH
jgi:hypothetical protein